MSTKIGNNAAPPPSKQKLQKRADALRENLQKRKQQTRARDKQEK